MLFASSLVKILLFPNAARPSSTDIMGYICRRTAWLSFVRNTQILTRLAWEQAPHQGTIQLLLVSVVNPAAS